MNLLMLRAIFVMALTLFIASLSYADPTSAPGEVAEGIFGESSTGRGEPDSSTGAMTYSYRFNLPDARGRPQPALSLTYNSFTRDREAGFGWGLNLPVIERKPLSGNPCFTKGGEPIACGERRTKDESGALITEERYTFNGQPLVFICRLPGGTKPNDPECGDPNDQKQPDWAHIPDWKSGDGWRYYRLQVEGQFARFYHSRDRKYWRVQLKGGEVLEFGDANGSGVEHARGNKNAIIRWRLLRHIDELHSSGGVPNNVEYRWKKIGKRGLLYLTDIFDTPRVDGQGGDQGFAHHTQLFWEPPDFPQTFYADAYKATPDLRLSRVAVASMPWSGTGPREVMRSYRLSYFPAQGVAPFKTKTEPTNFTFLLWHHSFLREISMQGRCEPGDFEDQSGNILPESACMSNEDKARGITRGNVLPATTFEYKTNGVSGLGVAFLSKVEGKPPAPFDENNALPYLNSVGIVDFNLDGFPDIVQGWNTEHCPGNLVNDGFSKGDNDSIEINAQLGFLQCKQRFEGWEMTVPFQSARPITAYLNKGLSYGQINLSYQCMDAGGTGVTEKSLGLTVDVTGLTHFNAGRPPGFLSNRGGATLVGKWSEGVVAWSNAQFAPFRTKPLLMGYATTLGNTPSSPAAFAGGSGCDPNNFVENDFHPAWKWEKTQVDYDWAKPALNDPDFTLSTSSYGSRVPRWFVDIDGDGLIDRLAGTGKNASPDLEIAYVEPTRRYAKDGPLPFGYSNAPAEIPFVYDGGNDAISLAPAVKPSEKKAYCGDKLPDPAIGTVHPEDLLVPADPATGKSAKWMCSYYTKFSYVDINGDGFVDLVTYNPADTGGPMVRPGNGTGYFGCVDALQPWPCKNLPSEPTSAYEIQTLGTVRPWPFTPETFFHDVTGDGLADIIRYDMETGGVYLWVNQDGNTFACLVEGCGAFIVWNQQKGSRDIGPHKVTFADMDADGHDDIVILTNKGAYTGHFMKSAGAYYPLDRGEAPQTGLLIRIQNGYGATTDVQYETIQQLDMKVRETPAAWNYHSPLVQSVVTKIAVVDSPSENNRWSSERAPFPFRFDYVNKYFYKDPAYDRWSRSFAGFRKVAVQRGDEEAVTATTYWFGPCQNNRLNARLPGMEYSPLCPQGSDNDEYKSWAGHTARIDRMSFNRWSQGPVSTQPGGDSQSERLSRLRARQDSLLWTKTFEYARHTLYERSDRRVSYAYPTKIDTYLYDDAKPAVLDGVHKLVDGGDDLENPSRQPGIRRHLRQSVEYDKHGNVKKIVREGAVKDELGDEADPVSITLFSPDHPSSADGPSGPDDSPATIPCDANWQCLPRYVSVWDPKRPFNTPLRKWKYSYTKAGDIQSIEGWLDQAQPLDRHHAVPGAGFAPSAPNQSLKLGWHLLNTLSYDAVGNLIRQSGGLSADGSLLQCMDYAYDSPYLHLLTTVNRFHKNCNGQGLAEQLAYDRGFGKVVSVTAPNGSSNSVVLDSFGRTIEVHSPNPDVPLTAGSILAATIAYYDSSPLSFVEIRGISGGSTDSRFVTIVNGLGESILNFDQESDKEWVLSGWVAKNKAGRTEQVRRPWKFVGNPFSLVYAPISSNPVPAPPDNWLNRAYYDGFGRIKSVWKQENSGSYELLRRTYFPLTVESRDAEQVKVGGTHGTALSRLEFNGFGQSKRNTLHIGNPTPEDIITTINYLPTGEPSVITRAHAGRVYSRELKYDTFGRLVHNLEPNTGNNWRYVWDDAGRLAGTSDARGCGVNLNYDGLGRLLGEDYSPCLAAHAPYTPPNLNTGSGLEVFYQYDAYESGQVKAETGFDDQPNYALGNLIAVRDRGSYTRFNYDVRDRVRRVSRQVAKPGDGSGISAYVPRWYTSRLDYALDDQLERRTTGVDEPDLLMNGASEERYSHSPSGRLLEIDSSYGPIIKKMSYDAEGAPTHILYGDPLGTTATVEYDERRRLNRHTLSNPISPLGDFFTGWFDINHFDYQYSFDAIGNPLSIVDASHRFSFIGLPPQAKPVLRRDMNYDDLYRLTNIRYSYRDGSGNNAWHSPFEAEINANDRRPMPQRAVSSRINHQKFQYDGMGNITKSEDDLNTRYDRSLGGVGYGTSGSGPNQFRASDGLTSYYDEAGNLSELKIERPGVCPNGQASTCAQWFKYDWDEVGQLARARRWDFNGNTLPLTFPAAKPSWDLTYAYSQGSRVRKSATAASGSTAHSLEIFDTLRVERAPFESTNGEYQLKPDNIHAYVGGIGHVFWDSQNNLPHQTPLSQIGMHLILADHLGSSSVVINHATSELVERTSYLPYGAVESDYRPEKWNAFREPYKFTGKEEDIEVGLTYFGARYYQPNLGRFISPDPLTIHVLGSDLNAYSYVGGRVTTLVDPTGLDPTPRGHADDIVYVDVLVRGEPRLPLLENKANRPITEVDAGTSVPIVSPQPAPVIGVPFWQVLGNPNSWSPSVDPAVIEGFNEGVSRNKEALAGTGLVAGVSLGIMSLEALGVSELLELGGAGLDSLGEAAFVHSYRAVMAFNELTLAEQGIVIGGGGGGALFAKRYAGSIAPGLYAGPRILSVNGSKYAGGATRKIIRDLMSKHGCHTCGTKIGKAHADHQPPNALNLKGFIQWLFPQCSNCSNNQSHAVKRAVRDK